MTDDRKAQIIAAIEWATGKAGRSASAETHGANFILNVGEWEGADYCCLNLKEDDGTDFPSLLAQKRETKARKEYEALKAQFES